ncbi:MAG: response regulator [Verrucomicrobiales bacterium]|nr:response regulator [Verrucomicrobiales bacterium]
MTAAPTLENETVRLDAIEHELERLRQANRYLMTAMDQVADGVVIFHPGAPGGEPYVMYANCQASMLLGMTPDRGLREKSLSELARDEVGSEVLLKAFAEALGSMGGSVCRCSMASEMVEEGVVCDWRVRAVVDEHGALLNFTARFEPVREEVAVVAGAAAEEDLDAQTRRLRTENMAALAQGIAHDVNNLLGPMMAQLSSTLARLTQTQTAIDAELEEELQLMFGALKRARQFTQQVVSTARAQADARAPVDVMKLAEETVRLCRAGSNVEVRVHAAEGTPWAQADAVRISQVLQNLVMNGMQAMPRGGWLDVRLAPCVLAADNEEKLNAGRYLRIEVADRGVGIAPENLKRMFKESFTTKPDGNGIGLTTCKRFIEEHDGAISVQSTLGVGTQFSILLPAVEAPHCKADAVGTDMPESAPIPLQNGSGCVLIVDDEKPLRHVARCILTRCGYQVLEADSGEDAIRIYKDEARRQNEPDVVLMDLTLRGGLSGTEAARDILADFPQAQLVVTSGSVTEDVQRIFLEQGFVDVLAKPYEAGALTRKVSEVIAAASSRQLQVA